MLGLWRQTKHLKLPQTKLKGFSFINLPYNHTINQAWTKQKWKAVTDLDENLHASSVLFSTSFFSPILLCGCFHQKTTFVFLNAFRFCLKEAMYSRKQRESWDSIIKWLNSDIMPMTLKSISFLLFWHLHVFFTFILFKTCQHITHLSKIFLRINMTAQTKHPLCVENQEEQKQWCKIKTLIIEFLSSVWSSAS